MMREMLEKLLEIIIKAQSAKTSTDGNAVTDGEDAAKVTVRADGGDADNTVTDNAVGNAVTDGEDTAKVTVRADGEYTDNATAEAILPHGIDYPRFASAVGHRYSVGGLKKPMTVDEAEEAAVRYFARRK